MHSRGREDITKNWLEHASYRIVCNGTFGSYYKFKHAAIESEFHNIVDGYVSGLNVIIDRILY
jgi:hypothetical protein